ncbi:DUF4113 domain-containing protein [uncultured Sphingomonas sp.]|uniref:DUF4113 domain-containing protein n=1 Tax=uncultured Sphingomonas sp. TaxID=158754 RepID=UPI002620DE60|nr:DUF4113 domain-containing protein [uncultured Sphingomonas sp.]
MSVPAAQGFKYEWKMHAESRSPAWTTPLDEVPVVCAKYRLQCPDPSKLRNYSRYGL